jgi:hypothetical protein
MEPTQRPPSSRHFLFFAGAGLLPTCPPGAQFIGDRSQNTYPLNAIELVAIHSQFSIRSRQASSDLRPASCLGSAVWFGHKSDGHLLIS